MHKAVGIHVFAGGFTMGVQKVFDVECQLESHGFGKETCEEVVGVPFVNDPDAKWPDVRAEMAFGNPRCTGFSCITSGYGEDTHGPWAKQTEDIHQLCEYAAGRFDIIVWESVQQAFSTGRPLLNYLRDEVFAPKGYRVAHVLLNAASFGNAQQRRRYFFIAYRDDRNFNIDPPAIDLYYPVLYDVIYSMRDRVTNCRPLHKRGCDYDFDSYLELTKNEQLCVPKLPNGWNLNMMGRYMYDDLPPKFKDTWRFRASEMPFSMHCILRLNWLRPHPTIHSSAGRFIHPDHHRPMTVGELATVMGWEGKIPRGAQPIPQIAKGVVPSAGTWLARQAELYLTGAWGSEDFESSYDAKACEWVGRDTTGEREKVFNLTNYVGQRFDKDRYDVPYVQRHRCHVEKRPR